MRYNIPMAGHTHGATSGPKLWLSLGLTLTFVAVETFFGLRSHSLALLSDAGHNFSDALALALAAYAIWIARRPANRGKTFGYHRVAILTAFANAAALIGIALGILIEAWQSFHHPQTPQGTTMMAVAAVAVVMNTVIASWLSADARHSLNARAAYLHMLGDALSSFGVVLAGLAVKTTGWTLADPLMSVLIALFILSSSWGVINEAANVLMEGTPKGLDIDALLGAMRQVPHVLDLHDLHVWTVGDGMHFLSCHVVLADTTTMAESASVVHALNERLAHDFAIGHATIQTEMADAHGCRVENAALYCAPEAAHHHHHGCVHG